MLFHTTASDSTVVLYLNCLKFHSSSCTHFLGPRHCWSCTGGGGCGPGQIWELVQFRV